MDNNLKASSLINAIFICLIISVFCGSLVLISHYQNILNIQLDMREGLISRNESSFNHFINNADLVPYNEIQELDVFEDNIHSYFEKKNWGFYDVFICKTIFKNDTISKITLVGQKQSAKNNLALYVTNYDKPLKLSGNTKILGQIKVPNGRTELAYINGQKGNTIELRGPLLKSKDKLPKIDKDILIDDSGFISISINTFEKEMVLVNGFDKTTKVIDLTNISRLKDIVLKGNIVIVSKGELEIDNTAKLHDILVIAPKIHIMSGFIGNIQIIAKESVTIDKNVKLLYPSSIYSKNDNAPITVNICEDSIIIGGVVLDGDTYNGALSRRLTIDEGATVIGNVYCYGSTQLQGKVIGSVYTDRFFLKTKSSNYENVILNGTINRVGLPKNFIELPLFKNDFNEKQYAVIKEF